MKYGLLTAAAACLSSCIYSDLGRTIGSIGSSVPRIVPVSSTDKQNIYCGHLYRKAGKYYVELPLAWVPERRKGYECMTPFSSSGDIFNDNCTYNRPYTAEELQQYPVEKIYFEAVNSPQYSYINRDFISHHQKADSYGARGIICADLQPAADFTPDGAEYLGLYGVDGAPHRIGHLGKRRADYYPLLYPLQVVAKAVDIPLSIILMPVSTPILCTAMEFNCEAAFPYHDDSRRNFMDFAPLYPTDTTEETQKTQ